MEQLEKERAEYVRADVEKSVAEVEEHVAKLDKDKCRQAYRQDYIRYGRFFIHSECRTKWMPVRYVDETIASFRARYPKKNFEILQDDGEIMVELPSSMFYQ